MSKLYNLELWKRVEDKWRLYSTLIWNAPYSLCRGEKLKKQAYKSHFEFYKITPNGKPTKDKEITIDS